MTRAVIVAVLLAGTALPAAADETCHRLIVKQRDAGEQSPATTQQMRRLQSAGGVEFKYRRTLGNGAHVVEKGGKLAPDAGAGHRALLARLRADPEVEYAECDARRYASVVPNDPYYTSTLPGDPEQWYLKDTAGGIRAEQAWNITLGDSAVVTAVVDSGIQDYPGELVRLLDGYDFVSEDAPLDYFTANDGDGRDEDETDPGDWVEAGDCGEGEPARDSSWHGTRIAGIIAAETDNGTGIAGIDWNGYVLPVRALGRCGGFISDIAEAIRWAAGLPVIGVRDNGFPADVINLSLGSAGSCSNTEREAIQAAVDAGALVVAAAGNEGGDTANAAPANCNVDGMVVVAATTRQGAETCYTNVGEEVDLSAPGGNNGEGVCSPDPGDVNYSTSNDGADTPGDPFIEAGVGTSFATPMVSGAAALLRAVAPGLTPVQMETVLKNSARAFPAGTSDGFDDCTTSRCGTGILDIKGALDMAAGIDATPAPFSFTDRTGIKPGETVVSDAVTIEGINIATPVGIDNGEYSVDDEDFTDTNGYVEAGQAIRIRLTAAGAHSTTVSATLTAGGVSDTFSVTTKSTQIIQSGGGGGSTGAGGLVLLAAAALMVRRRPRRLSPHYPK